VNTRDTAARVRGVSWCAKNRHRTRTRVTRLGNTAGLPVPVLKPTHSKYLYLVEWAIASHGMYKSALVFITEEIVMSLLNFFKGSFCF
jgi:hypothetical protein